MSTEVIEIATPDLVSETVVRGDRIEVRFVGSGEAVTLFDLAAYLEALHRFALDTAANEIAFDLRALEFMSAACVRSMLAWMAELQRTPSYVARFIVDPRKPWQGRTVQTLASFGGDLVRI
jgi:hypothetical protein